MNSCAKWRLTSLVRSPGLSRRASDAASKRTTLVPSVQAEVPGKAIVRVGLDPCGNACRHRLRDAMLAGLAASAILSVCGATLPVMDTLSNIPDTSYEIPLSEADQTALRCDLAPSLASRIVATWRFQRVWAWRLACAGQGGWQLSPFERGGWRERR